MQQNRDGNGPQGELARAGYGMPGGNGNVCPYCGGGVSYGGGWQSPPAFEFDGGIHRSLGRRRQDVLHGRSHELGYAPGYEQRYGGSYGGSSFHRPLAEDSQRDVKHEPAHHGVFAFQAGRPEAGIAPNPHQEQAHGRHYDADYYQWRNEQMRRFDDDYAAWRKDRYGQLTNEFDQWRRLRLLEDGNQGSRPRQRDSHLGVGGEDEEVSGVKDPEAH